VPVQRIKRQVQETSHLFTRFKFGEKALSFPLALAMCETLSRRGHVRFDAIVPIPLSPAKKRAGEIDRTHLLARHLGRLLRLRVVRGLALMHSISKRQFMKRGTRREFEDRYHNLLTVRPALRGRQHILLVDDVCTHGSTLSVAYNRLREFNPECTVVATTAGLMVRKETVKRRRAVIARSIR
jgi:predicted amidophosphoribosyltransferase